MTTNDAMYNKTATQKGAKQSFFVRLSAKIKSLIKANKVEKTNTKAVHARNRAESKFWLKVKPVMEAFWQMLKIAAVGFFGTLNWHVIAKLIVEGTEFLSQIVFWRLLVAGTIAGAIVYGVQFYKKQKRMHLHKYTKTKKATGEYAKYLARKPLLYASATFAAVLFVPYLIAAICDFGYLAFVEAFYVLDMVFVSPVGLLLVLAFVAKASYGLYQAQIREWDRIAAKNAPKR